RPEHHVVAWGRAAERMARRIVLGVRLDLGDPAVTPSDDEALAEQLGGDDGRVAGEERHRQSLRPNLSGSDRTGAGRRLTGTPVGHVGAVRTRRASRTSVNLVSWTATGTG